MSAHFAKCFSDVVVEIPPHSILYISECLTVAQLHCEGT